MVDWHDVKTAPKDGTVILGAELYRYKKYKPQARKQGYPDGRWQRHNGHGWENSQAPEYWTHLPSEGVKHD